LNSDLESATNDGLFSGSVVQVSHSHLQTMFSSYLRLLTTQQPRQFTRPFFSKKPEPANQPQANTVKPRLNMLPILTYDGQGPINGYFVSLENASEKRAALAQLEGCNYTIMHEFEDYPFFSGLVAYLPFVCVFIFMIS